jgi:hypothetical protein
MQRRFRARRDELLGDAEVHPGLLRGLAPRPEGFVRPFVAALGSGARRRNATHYIRGPVPDPGGKTAEAIAYLHDRERQGPQTFVGQSPWDHRPLPTEPARRVGAELGGPDGVPVFGPSAFPEKGTASVGVQRPWCGRLGGLENGPVGISLASVSRRDHALADVRPYPPEGWGTRPRRRGAGVPRAIRFRTRHGSAPEGLDGSGPALPHARVSGDGEVGRSSWFRRQPRSRGECDLLAVPSNTPARDPAAPDPPYPGCGRPPPAPFGRADRWAAVAPAGAWQTIAVRDGVEGPLVVRAVRTSVQARAGNRASDVAEPPVVFRERRGDGAREHDDLPSDAPLGTPLAEFARVFEARHRVEECPERAEGEAGLADYQVRTREGWHRHQALSLVAAWLLTRGTRRGEKADPGADGPAGPAGDRAAPPPAAGVRPPGPHPPGHDPPAGAERGGPVLPLPTMQTLAASAG